MGKLKISVFKQGEEYDKKDFDENIIKKEDYPNTNFVLHKLLKDAPNTELMVIDLGSILRPLLEYMAEFNRVMPMDMKYTKNPEDAFEQIMNPNPEDATQCEFETEEPREVRRRYDIESISTSTLTSIVISQVENYCKENMLPKNVRGELVNNISRHALDIILDIRSSSDRYLANGYHRMIFTDLFMRDIALIVHCDEVLSAKHDEMVYKDYWMAVRDRQLASDLMTFIRNRRYRNISIDKTLEDADTIINEIFEKMMYHGSYRCTISAAPYLVRFLKQYPDALRYTLENQIIGIDNFIFYTSKDSHEDIFKEANVIRERFGDNEFDIPYSLENSDNDIIDAMCDDFGIWTVKLTTGTASTYDRDEVIDSGIFHLIRIDDDKSWGMVENFLEKYSKSVYHPFVNIDDSCLYTPDEYIDKRITPEGEIR